MTASQFALVLKLSRLGKVAAQRFEDVINFVQNLERTAQQPFESAEQCQHTNGAAIFLSSNSTSKRLCRFRHNL